MFTKSASTTVDLHVSILLLVLLTIRDIMALVKKTFQQSVGDLAFFASAEGFTEAPLICAAGGRPALLRVFWLVHFKEISGLFLSLILTSNVLEFSGYIY